MVFGLQAQAIVLGLLYIGGEVQLNWYSVRVACSSTTA